RPAAAAPSRPAAAGGAASSAATTTAGPLDSGAELEHAGILQEEVPFFRKEQAETRQVHLLLVGFNLGKVGVDREVPGQAARESVFRVEAGLCVAFHPAGSNRLAARQDVRFQPQVVARTDSAQSCERAGHRHAVDTVDTGQW